MEILELKKYGNKTDKLSRRRQQQNENKEGQSVNFETDQLKLSNLNKKKKDLKKTQSQRQY